MELQTSPPRLRLAELVAALSLGIDLGFSQPMEHVLRQCRIALRLAERLGLDEAQRATVYYAALLVTSAATPMRTSRQSGSVTTSPSRPTSIATGSTASGRPWAPCAASVQGGRPSTGFAR